jgi:hypothetical protein
VVTTDSIKYGQTFTPDICSKKSNNIKKEKNLETIKVDNGDLKEEEIEEEDSEKEEEETVGKCFLKMKR